MYNGLTEQEREARQNAIKSGLYFAQSGAVRYLIDKDTGKKVLTAFSLTEMNSKVVSLMR